MTPSEKNLIGYSFKATGNRFFVGTNPATQEDFPTQFVQATSAEVDEAARLAEEAFDTLGLFNEEKWFTFIDCICAEIEDNRKELLFWFQAETALPSDRAENELNRSVLQFKQYAAGLKSGLVQGIKIDSAQLDGTTKSKQDLRKINVPLGPVVVFGASNFPFAYSTLGGDVASAFAAGCPVIVKAHPMHPHTSSLSAQCILNAAHKAGMPEGVFSHVNGIDYDVAERLILHPAIKAVGFTGSIQGGLSLVKLAQSREVPIPVYAEMGSVNPIICLPEALKKRHEEIAIQIAQSISLNAGQFCTSPGLIFLIDDEYSKAFITCLTKELDSVAPQAMIHKGLRDNYLKNRAIIEDQTTILLSKQSTENWVQPGLTRVDGEIFIADPRIQEEVFGAFACLIVCANEEELKKAVKTLRGQLTITLQVETKDKFIEYQQLILSKAGRIIINGVPTGVEIAPAQQHGGPFPSSSSVITAVGADAVTRFMRPISFQNVPEQWLTNGLKNVNKPEKLRFVNEELNR